MIETNRRRFITASMAGGVAAGLGYPWGRSTAQEGPIMPVVPGPEIDAFRKAQQALLKKYDVTAKSRYIKLKKPPLTVHVLEAGSGDSVLMLHGGGSFGCSFAPLMGALQKEVHLAVPDRPGCGLTDKFDYRETALRQHAVDFVTGVLDALDWPKAALVGNSMGGLWALQFALAEPKRVTKLLLLGEPAWSAEEAHPPPKRSKTPTFEGVRAGFAARLVADPNHLPDELVEAGFASELVPGSNASWNSLIEKFLKDKEGTYHLRPELKNLRPATLFIWGDKDKFGPPSLGVEMAKLAPNARCEVLRDGGHYIWLDHPERCAKLSLQFLKDGK